MGRPRKEDNQEIYNYRDVELKRVGIDRVEPPSYSIVISGPGGSTKNITVTESEVAQIRRILLRGGD